MLVKYKAVGGSVYTLLFDESAGDANEKFAPSFRDSVYKSTAYGADNQVRIPLSNTDGQTQFRWSKNYADAATAFAAIAAFRAAFKGIAVHLQITIDTTVLYLPNASLTGSTHDQHGREVLHAASFDHDDLTITAP